MVKNIHISMYDTMFQVNRENINNDIKVMCERDTHSVSNCVEKYVYQRRVENHTYYKKKKLFIYLNS